ncbi:hypothetical protein MMYC01_205115 [Madurella mycetomatis]|uniref:Mmc1 C-terminal domain-containing protein n=1 Tax=Madurella mycetomatis TaxID=100816 RepID=A0A175W5K7_9PEZI|nr:hypothetical protein MMYC01_205115 [Madurella mycetomatis]
MPPALGLGRVLTRSRRLPAPIPNSSICLFCSFSPSRRSPQLSSLSPRPGRKPTTSRRHQSATTYPPPNSSPSSSNPREDLQRALLDLQSHAADHVNLPRLHLALRNLSQPPGHESIRVAFLGTSPPQQPTTTADASSKPNSTAKRLLHLVLADPLQPAQAWEAQLEAHDTGRRPLIVRVGAAANEQDGRRPAEGEEEEEEEGRLTPVREHVVAELRVSSPLLNRGDLDVLVAEVGGSALAARQAAGGAQAVEDAMLVPTVDVASTTAGHVAPVGTPVHMAVLVGDGVLGAAGILSLPILEQGDVITAAVNFGGRLGEADLASCPLVPVNVDAGREGLALFREDINNAMKFEALWSEADIGRISEWLRGNALASGKGAAIQEREARSLSAGRKAKVSSGSIAHLDQALSQWAQSAHEELQQQLDVAFAGRAWKKLGWWKLFWHADDVGMVTSEMVALRFLPEAEKGITYLAGRIEEAGVVERQSGHPLYSGPTLIQPKTDTHTQDEVAPITVAKWPTHILFTRNYLQEKTVPALQALAQKLVVQSASLAGLSSALAGLSYLSALGAYECGAIAALGIVLSFKRLQQKWDAAREYWEGEVREEGRKAIRASEVSIAKVLDEASKPPDGGATDLGELRKAEEIIKRAENALARME